MRIVSGNILDDDADALVNPVNCVGVCGKGLALEFKRKFPDNFKEYKIACEFGSLGIGKIRCIPINEDRFIVNFPTKNDWRNPSKLEYIIQGLSKLKVWIKYYNIKSIAIPALGCGLGGLKWEKVKILLEYWSQSIPDVDVRVYEPK